MSDFQFASERLELAVNSVATIANGCPPDSALPLLCALQFDADRHGAIIDGELDRLTALGDGPIRWPHGRGLSGLARIPDSVFPHVWSSAHEAARAVAELALDCFYRPLNWQGDYSKLTKEQRQLFDKLLDKKRRAALAMSIEEVAEWQERVRRERAKLLRLEGEQINKLPSLPGNPLTETEYGVLQQLAKVYPQLIKITDLSADLNCGRTSASEAVKQLEARNLVKRQGERSGVSITDAGLSALRPADRPRIGPTALNGR